MTYERLEFLGDAYLEVFASRLIFSRFNQLPAGQMSQLRELLVKNETLAEYGRAYGFDRQVKVADMERMKQDCRDKAGNKALNKVIGDVFEAYIAAIVLSKPESGFAEAEEWCTRLWEAKIQGWTKHRSGISMTNEATRPADGSRGEDKLSAYNPAAKMELQQRIMYGDVKLQYEVDRPTVELKGDRLGQNEHFIALYLTGYGHDRKLLGKGVGRNKVEAGNWAATQAMHGETKALVDACESTAKELKEQRKRVQAEKRKAEEASSS
jgi:ribonuclease-3